MPHRADPGLSPPGYERSIRVHPPRSAPIRVPETPPATREESAQIRPDPPQSAYQRPLPPREKNPRASAKSASSAVQAVVVRGACAQGRTGLKPSATREKSASIRPDPPKSAASAVQVVVVRGVCAQDRTGLKPSATREKSAQTRPDPPKSAYRRVFRHEETFRANPPRPAQIRVPESVPPRRKKIRAHPQNPRHPRFRSLWCGVCAHRTEPG